MMTARALAVGLALPMLGLGCDPTIGNTAGEGLTAGGEGETSAGDNDDGDDPPNSATTGVSGPDSGDDPLTTGNDDPPDPTENPTGASTTGPPIDETTGALDPEPGESSGSTGSFDDSGSSSSGSEFDTGFFDPTTGVGGFCEFLDQTACEFFDETCAWDPVASACEDA